MPGPLLDRRRIDDGNSEGTAIVAALSSATKVVRLAVTEFFVMVPVLLLLISKGELTWSRDEEEEWENKFVRGVLLHDEPSTIVDTE